MGSKQYSEEFKKSAVQKFLSRGSRSVDSIVEETGASSHSLYAWAREYAKGTVMEKDQKRPQDRSTQEKFKAVVAFDHLPLEGPDQGVFLRREGFHTAHIDEWRAQMQKGLEAELNQTTTRSEMSKMSAEIRDLKKEMIRKNAALAETTALLVLKKKADLIWGIGESE